MKKIAHLCIALAFLLTAAAVPATSAPAAQEEAPGALSEQDQVARWNLYVEFSNLLHDFLKDDGLKDYFRVAGEKAEVNKKHEETRFILSFSWKIVNKSDKLLKSIENVKKFQAAHPSGADLDKATALAADRTLHILQTMSKVSSYYKEKEYVDDDFKKGQEVHTEMLAATKDYDAVLGNLHRLLAMESGEVQKREVAAMRAKGLEIRPLMIESINAAVAVRQNLDTQREENKTFDLAAYRADYDVLSQKLARLSELAADAAALQKEGLNPSRAARFIEVLKEIKRDAAGVIEKATADPKRMPSDSDSLSRNTNRLVNAYNELN